MDDAATHEKPIGGLFEVFEQREPFAVPIKTHPEDEE